MKDEEAQSIKQSVVNGFQWHPAAHDFLLILKENFFVTYYYKYCLIKSGHSFKADYFLFC